MARLPDIPESLWIEDQQNEFDRSTAPMWDATMFDEHASDLESQIPKELDPTPEEIEQQRILAQRQQEAADQERKKQEGDAQYQKYLQAQKDYEAQQAQQVQDANAQGIRSPDGFAHDIMGAENRPYTSTSPDNSSSGVLDPASSPASSTDTPPPVSTLDDFNKYAGSLQDAIGQDPTKNLQTADGSYATQQAISPETPEGPAIPGESVWDRTKRIANQLWGQAESGVSDLVTNPTHALINPGLGQEVAKETGVTDSSLVQHGKDTFDSVLAAYDADQKARDARTTAGYPDQTYDTRENLSNLPITDTTRQLREQAGLSPEPTSTPIQDYPQLPEEAAATAATSKATQAVAQEPLVAVADISNAVLGDPQEKRRYQDPYGIMKGMGLTEGVTVGDVIANAPLPIKILEAPQWISMAGQMIENPEATGAGLAFFGSLGPMLRNPVGRKAALAVVGGLAGAFDEYVQQHDLTGDNKATGADYGVAAAGGAATALALPLVPRLVKGIATSPTAQVALRRLDLLAGRAYDEVASRVRQKMPAIADGILGDTLDAAGARAAGTPYWAQSPEQFQRTSTANRLMRETKQNLGLHASLSGGVGAALGAGAGIAAGVDASDENTPLPERIGKIGAGALAGTIIGGSAGSYAGLMSSMGAAKLIGSLVEHGHVSPDIFDAHPDYNNRIAAVMLSLARDKADNEVITGTPASASMLQKLQQSLDPDFQLRMPPPDSTAGEIRDFYKNYPAQSVGRAARDIIVDHLTNTSYSADRAHESGADIAMTRGLVNPNIADRPPTYTQSAPASNIRGMGGEQTIELNASHPVYQQVKAVTDKLGIPEPRLFVAHNDQDINASAFPGTGNRPVIVLNTAILGGDKLAPDEFEALLMHELAHATDVDTGRGLLQTAEDYVRSLVQKVPRAADQLGMVPPRVVDQMTHIPVKTDYTPAEQRAIRLAGGNVDENGVAIGVTRAQGESAAGGVAVRGGPFYEPVPEGERASFWDTTAIDNAHNVGGATVIPRTETRYRNPLIVHSSPSRSHFTDGYEKVGLNSSSEEDITNEIHSLQEGSKPGSPARLNGLKGILTKWGGDPTDAVTMTSLRGVSGDESVLAVLENILGTRARQQGHDAVFHIDHESGGDTGNLSEILSTREDRNPVPAPLVDKPAEDVQASKARMDDALRRYQDANSVANDVTRERDNTPVQQRTPESEAEHLKVQDEVANSRGAYIAARDAHDAVVAGASTPENAQGPANYSLRPDPNMPVDVRRQTFGYDSETSKPAWLPTEAQSSVIPKPEGRWVVSHGIWGTPLEFAADEAAAKARAAELKQTYHFVPQHELDTYPEYFNGLPNNAEQYPPHADNIPGLMFDDSGQVWDLGTEPPVHDPTEVEIGDTVAPRGAAPLKKLPASIQNNPMSQQFQGGTPPPSKVDKGLYERASEWWATNATDSVARLSGYMNDVAKQYYKQTGMLLPAENMVANLKRLDPNKAAEVMIDTMFKPALRTFKEIGVPNSTVDKYLAATQYLDIARHQGNYFQTGLMNRTRSFPGGVTADNAQDFLLEFENDMRANWTPEHRKKFGDAIQQVWDLGDTTLKMIRDNGLITDQAYTDMRKAYPHYVPTKIIEHLSDNATTGLGKSLSITSNTIKALSHSGTDKDAVSPLSALVGMVYESHAASRKNQVFNAFLGLWQAASDISPHLNTTRSGQRVQEFMDLIQPVSSGTAKGNEWNTVQGFYNGDKIALAVHKDLGNISQYDAPAIIPVVSGMMNFFKSTVTSRNPLFLARNLMLDWVDYMIRETARDGGTPAAAWRVYGSYAESLMHALVTPEAISNMFRHEYNAGEREFLSKGGGYAGYTPRSAYQSRQTINASSNDKFEAWLGRVMNHLGRENLSPADEEVRRLQRGMIELKNPGDVAKLIGDFMSFKPVEALGEHIELAPRVAAMKNAQRRASVGLRALSDEHSAVSAYEQAIANGQAPPALPARWSTQAGTPRRTSTDIQAAIKDAQLRSDTDSANAGRTVTIDFGKGGNWSRWINQIIPFFNVGMQALVDPVRATRENPRQFLSTLTTAAVTPMIIAEALNNRNEQTRKDYDDVPQFLKDEGLVLMLPNEWDAPQMFKDAGIVQTSPGGGTVSKFAAPVDENGNRHPQFIHVRYRQFAPIAALTREVLQRTIYNNGGAKRGIPAIVAATLESISPVSATDPKDLAVSMTVPAVSTAIQLGFNTDTFRNRAIISKHADDSASPLSHALADRFGYNDSMSRPSWWEFATRDTLGGYASVWHGASEILAGKKATSLQDQPVIGGLVGGTIKGSTGEQGDRARTTMLSDESLQFLRDNKLTWRPEAAQSHIHDVDLTQNREAEYQITYNEAQNKAIQEARAAPSFVAAKSPDDKQKILDRYLAYYRDLATEKFYAQMPMAEKEAARARARAKLVTARGGTP